MLCIAYVFFYIFLYGLVSGINVSVCLSVCLSTLYLQIAAANHLPVCLFVTRYNRRRLDELPYQVFQLTGNILDDFVLNNEWVYDKLCGSTAYQVSIAPTKYQLQDASRSTNRLLVWSKPKCFCVRLVTMICV